MNILFLGGVFVNFMFKAAGKLPIIYRPGILFSFRTRQRQLTKYPKSYATLTQKTQRRLRPGNAVSLPVFYGSTSQSQADLRGECSLFLRHCFPSPCPVSLKFQRKPALSTARAPCSSEDEPRAPTQTQLTWRQQVQDHPPVHCLPHCLEQTAEKQKTQTHNSFLQTRY